MRNEEFELFLSMVARLDVEQKQRLEAALAGGGDEAVVIGLLEARLRPEPACPHCRAEGSKPWGQSHGLRRFRCAACSRTFNALTGTPLARLRKKAQWSSFTACLSRSDTVRKAAKVCRVAVATSFRWRHRFLRAGVADAEALSGIVEADETFFRRSFKGSRGPVRTFVYGP